MVEIERVAMNIVSLVINVGLVYFAVRLLLFFRGGKIGKPWAYISSGVLALAGSSFLFSLYLLVMMTGGALLLIGMYLEHKHWTRAP